MRKKNSETSCQNVKEIARVVGEMRINIPIISTLVPDLRIPTQEYVVPKSIPIDNLDI